MKLKIYSISDVITNSSTEIFKYVTSNTYTLVKEFIQNILDASGSNKSVDDLFEFSDENEDLQIFFKDGKDKYLIGILPEFYYYEVESDR